MFLFFLFLCFFLFCIGSIGSPPPTFLAHRRYSRPPCSSALFPPSLLVGANTAFWPPPPSIPPLNPALFIHPQIILYPPVAIPNRLTTTVFAYIPSHPRSRSSRPCPALDPAHPALPWISPLFIYSPISQIIIDLLATIPTLLTSAIYTYRPPPPSIPLTLPSLRSTPISTLLYSK